MTEATPLAQRLQQVMDGYLTTQLLYAASELGVLGRLAARPQTAAELARSVGVEPGPLARVLRGLVIEDVVIEDVVIEDVVIEDSAIEDSAIEDRVIEDRVIEDRAIEDRAIEDRAAEPGDGRFTLTPLGEALAGLAGPLRVRGGLYYRAAGGLLDALRTGATAFDTVYGRPFFAELDADRSAEAAFEASMAGRAVAEARDLVAAYDFGPYRTVVDVGGGRGVLLGAVLESVPEAAGILLDRPPAIRAARAHLAEAGLAERVRLVAGDFFEEVPAGGDLYLVARILHDWDDAAALRILRRCRAAMRPGARLLVVDALLPERARESPGAIRMDLHMLVLFGSAERTAGRVTALLDQAGFSVRRILPTTSPVGLAVVEAAPH